MPDRRVKVIFEAEVGGMKKGLSEATSATEKLAKATETAGKSVDERMQKINAVATADQKAAKAAGLLYNAQGQLADSNGKVLSSSQAAAHGVDAFSEAVYLSGHEAGVAAAATEAAAKKAADAAEKQKAAWQTVAPVMMAAGAGMVASVGLAVKKYADFDKAMSSVQAATHETTGNMGLLREAAMTAGADTAFSAEEAAQGVEELAKAGVSTSSILDGGLTGALSLAAAGNLSVAESAEFAASAMTQFGLEGKDIPHIADLLAAGAGKAQGSVRDMGLALSYAGLPAKGLGVSIEETAGTIAMFASNGLIGEKAGTALRGMFVSMANPAGKTAKLMDELGISFETANGEFIGMDGVAGVLQERLGGLTTMQRNSALAQIFGNEGLAAAQALYAGGAEKVREWTDAVNDSNYASETAAIMQNNLTGDLEKLGGSFDTVFLKAGGVGNDAFRGLVQGAERLIDVVGQIPAPILGVAGMITGIAGGALLLGGGLITAIPKIQDTRNALRDLAPAGSKAGKGLDKVKTGMVGITKAASAAGVIMAVGVGVGKLAEMSYTGDLIQGTGHVASALEDVAANGPGAISALDSIFKDRTGGGITEEVDGIDSAIEKLFSDDPGEKFDRWGQTVVNSLTGIRGSKQIAEEAFGGIDTELAALVTSGNAEDAATSFGTIQERMKAAGVTAEEAAHLFPQYADALQRAGTAGEDAVEPNEEAAAALEAVGVSAAGAVADMEAFLEQLFSMGNATMDSRDAAFAYQEQIRSIAEAQKEIAKGELGPALNKNKDDFNELTEAGKLANDEFQALARGGMDEIAKMSAEGLGQDELQDKLNTTYSDLVKAGEGFGLLPPQAAALAREVLQIPDGVDIKTWMDSEAKRLAEETKQGVEAIPGYASVAVAVSEDGTAGEVQSKVNAITGKTEYVFVTDDGTVVSVQQRIENVNGVERTVYVGDDGTVYSTQGKINSVKDGGAKVAVTDGGSVSVVQGLINRVKGKSVTITTSFKTNGAPYKAAPMDSINPWRRASGGSIFGPGTETSDSIPALLSTNEHVLSAREVRGLGGHSAVERLRAMARSGGAPAFAKGGAIGRAESKVKSTKRSYDLIDSKKANRLRKLAAKDQWEAAKDELAAVKKSSKASADAAKKTAEARKKAAEEERERQSRLSDSRRELRTDIRRGNIVDSFTGGSGLSEIDKLSDVSRNKDYSTGKRKAAARDANALEKALGSLTSKSEKLKTALEAATESRDELLSVKDSVAGGLRGENSLSGTLDRLKSVEGSGPLNAGSFVKSAQGKAAQIKRFGQLLEKLRKKGYSSSVVQEIAELGTGEGTQVGNALLGASTGEKNALNNAYKSMDYWSGQAGEEVTKSMRKGGIDAAEGLVNGLESKTKDVEGAFHKLGKDAEKAFRRSLDMHSPSRTLAIAGSDALDGVVVGVDSNRHKLESAMLGLGKAGEAAFNMAPAFSVPPSAEVARYAARPAAQAVVVDIDYNQLAQAMAHVQIPLKIGNKDIAQANTAGRKELRLPI